MSNQTELITTDSRRELSVGQMIQTVIQAGVTQENVAALDKLMELYMKVEERNSEKAFAEAFVALQSEMPNVKAVKPVPNNDGSIRYKYAPYEEIMEQVSPLLKKHGFTLTFSTDYKENRLVKICTLQHSAGHKVSNSFAVRVGQGPPKATECQADGAAATYAKRFALCDILNITIETDDDARAEGHPITLEQADELERRVKETNSDVAKFLKLAGAESFRTIMSNKYAVLDEALRRKESQGK